MYSRQNTGYKMTEKLGELALTVLDELKAQEITLLDVTALSDVMDSLIFATGTSSRHVKSLASRLVEEFKKQNISPIGVEGMDSSDWVLVDYGTVVVHVMLPQTRKFYDLEKLWSPIAGEREEAFEQSTI
jgi:ribosome-associated protein